MTENQNITSALWISKLSVSDLANQTWCNLEFAFETLHYPWIPSSTTVWMNSMVALYWGNNPEKQWIVFVVKHVQKVGTISNAVDTNWVQLEVSQWLMNVTDECTITMINNKFWREP